MLAQTGVAGDPESLFHREDPGAWAKALGIAPGPETPAYLRTLFAAAVPIGRGSTPVFALRLQRHSATILQRRLTLAFPDEATDRARLERAFGPLRFVYLRRANKLRQAISLVKAEQSGLWHRNADGSDYERSAASSPLTFDAARIAAAMAKYEAYDRAWEDWFLAENLSPLRLTYEDLSEAPRNELARVLSFLGLDSGSIGALDVPLKKLSDATTEAWVAAFERHSPRP